VSASLRREWWLQRRRLRARSCAVCGGPGDFVVEVVDTEDDGVQSFRRTVVVRALCSLCVHAARSARE
jgi:hypothetical protein